MWPWSSSRQSVVAFLTAFWIAAYRKLLIRWLGTNTAWRRLYPAMQKGPKPTGNMSSSTYSLSYPSPKNCWDVQDWTRRLWSLCGGRFLNLGLRHNGDVMLQTEVVEEQEMAWSLREVTKVWVFLDLLGCSSARHLKSDPWCGVLWVHLASCHHRLACMWGQLPKHGTICSHLPPEVAVGDLPLQQNQDQTLISFAWRQDLRAWSLSQPTH